MTTVYEESPLARAVRTKSDDSTASMEARVMRAIGATEKMASVSPGKRSCLRLAIKMSGSRAIRLSIR